MKYLMAGEEVIKPSRVPTLRNTLGVDGSAPLHGKNHPITPLYIQSP
jgi:hypothetical protein